MKLNRHHSLFKTGRIEESFQEHQLLMDALNERNTALSVRRMKEHFANGLEAAGSAH
jgi:DNA-binding GntR family transcriptional regulator